MPQVSWNLYHHARHRHLIRVGGSPAHYDEMTRWCKLNTKGDFLQSFGGDYPEVLHQFRFEKSDEAMMFKLIFGGEYGTIHV